MTNLSAIYEERLRLGLGPLAKALDEFLRRYLRDTKRIDRISVRAKSLKSFLDKAAKTENGQHKYLEPLNQINDQIGARIVTFYLSDVDRIASNALEIFHPIEEKLLLPDSVSEFGYEGKHFICLLPTDIVDKSHEGFAPPWFELQIKTLFQHAWAESGHDLGYKSPMELTHDQRRMLAFTAAQAWGADKITNDLFQQLYGRQLAP